MKLLFLDVDGVLNSYQYFCRHENDLDLSAALVDPAAVARLGRIVRESGAKVVLSSSWREGWDRDAGKLHPSLAFLNRALARENIRIEDKTPSFGTGKRGEEILCYLSRQKDKVESFAVIDDADYSWNLYGLEKRWVKTDFECEGLSDENVQQAIEILAAPIGLIQRAGLTFTMRKYNRKNAEHIRKLNC